MTILERSKMCRILMIDHPQFTHGSFFLWHGLKEIEHASWGHIEVEVYPHIPTYFNAPSFNLLDMDWYRDLEKIVETKLLPFGIPPFSPGEKLTYHGQELIHRYTLARPFLPPKEPLREFEIVESLNQGRFDLIVLANSHRVPTILLGRLKERVNPANMPPIVYYDAGERDELNEHWVHVFRPELVFKQILTPEVEAKGLSVPIPNYVLKMLPLPLSSIMIDHSDTKIGSMRLEEYQAMDDPNKKILDLFYPMGMTWDARKQVLDKLDSIVDSRRLNRVGPVTYENYHMMLAKSRMAVTMRGSGRDTLRYWEIPLYRTAMLCDGTMGCIHPYPFQHRRHAYFWRDPEDLEMLILPLLAKDPVLEAELRTIAEVARNHLKTYHSTMARALYFLDRIEEEMGITSASFEGVRRLKEARGWDPDRPWRGPVA